jgi:hypothetical protein
MSENPHLNGDALLHLESIIPDNHEMRFVGLLEACKFIEVELNLGRIENAKQYLTWAIAEAKKPWREENQVQEQDYEQG